MCIILLCDEKLPTLEDLRKSEKTNKDGGGIAWIENDKVHWIKGITADQIYDLLQTGSIKKPFIVHFRIASIGKIEPSLCHPFPVEPNVSLEIEGMADKVLFHNGHWSEFSDTALKAVISSNKVFPEGSISDSRVLAWLASIYGESILNFIPSHNRIAILDKDGIRYYGDSWKNHNGILCSNDIPFESQAVMYYGNPYYDKKDKKKQKTEDDEVCYTMSNYDYDGYGDWYQRQQGKRARGYQY